jgi:hypothetical protein
MRLVTLIAASCLPFTLAAQQPSMNGGTQPDISLVRPAAQGLAAARICFDPGGASTDSVPRRCSRALASSLSILRVPISNFAPHLAR